MILLVNGDDGFCDGATTGSAGGSALLLLISSESSSNRLVNENELLVFSTLLEEVLDMDSGSWSDFERLLPWLLLCDSELIKSSWSRWSISSEIEFSSDPSSSSLLETLEVMEEDCEMLSLSRISLSTNSRDDV